MSYQVKTIDHVSVLVSDTRRALKFYQDILGLEMDNSRPQLDFPGVWLTVGSATIHLLELSDVASEPKQSVHGGLERHIALRVSELEALVAVLERENIPFTRSRSGRRALFCRDPDGNVLECVEAV